MLKKQDLLYTVNELVTKKNPLLVSVYQDVMRYHFSKERKKYAHVQEMLMVPVRIKLALLNLILTLAALILFRMCLFGRTDIYLVYSGVAVLFLFAGWQIRNFLTSYSHLSEAMPYVLIDELIARKIIVLVPKNAQKTQQIKAASK